MRRQSPYTVTYSSLQALAEEILQDANGRLAGARSRGVTHLDPLIAREENARVLVKMLKKCQPGQQADLFTLFREVVK